MIVTLPPIPPNSTICTLPLTTTDRRIRSSSLSLPFLFSFRFELCLICIYIHNLGHCVMKYCMSRTCDTLIAHWITLRYSGHPPKNNTSTFKTIKFPLLLRLLLVLLLLLLHILFHLHKSFVLDSFTLSIWPLYGYRPLSVQFR